MGYSRFSEKCLDPSWKSAWTRHDGLWAIYVLNEKGSGGARVYRRLPGIDVGCSRFSSELDDLCPPCKQTDHVRAKEEYVCQSPKPTVAQLVIEHFAHNSATPFRQEEVVVIEVAERVTHK